CATFPGSGPSWWPGRVFSYPRSTAGPASRTSLHDLISQQQDRLWDRHAERAGRLDIADQLERGRLPDGQVPRFRAFQNAVDVRRRLPEQIGRLRAVGNERAGLGPLRVVDDRRETMLHREIEELRRDLVDGRVLPDQDRPVAFSPHLGEYPGELVGLLEANVADFDPELLGGVVRRLLIHGENSRM